MDNLKQNNNNNIGNTLNLIEDYSNEVEDDDNNDDYDFDYDNDNDNDNDNSDIDDNDNNNIDDEEISIFSKKIKKKY